VLEKAEAGEPVAEDASDRSGAGYPFALRRRPFVQRLKFGRVNSRAYCPSATGSGSAPPGREHST
jgi:hypothetical protein